MSSRRFLPSTTLLSGWILSWACRAATFSVDLPFDAVDINPGDGLCQAVANQNSCSLRAAVMEANALGGSHTIELGPGEHELTLTGASSPETGDLDTFTASLVIAGAGLYDTVISGGAIDRILDVSGSEPVVVRDLTMFGGYAPEGGAVNIRPFVPSVTFTRVGFGVNGADLEGGAIAARDTTVLIEESIFGGNQLMAPSGPGTAIHCDGCDLTLRATAFIEHIGGRSIVDVSGDATLRVLNSTFSDNNEGQLAIASLDANALILFSTFHVSSGMVAGSALDHFSFSGTHFMDIGASAFFDTDLTTCVNNTSFIRSLGHNVENGSSCPFDQPTDLSNTDPVLKSLIQGPIPTHVPGPESPLVNHVPASDCNDLLGNPLVVDQRGFPRPIGTGCDVGASEDVIMLSGFEHEADVKANAP